MTLDAPQSSAPGRASSAWHAINVAHRLDLHIYDAPRMSDLMVGNKSAHFSTGLLILLCVLAALVAFSFITGCYWLGKRMRR